MTKEEKQALLQKEYQAVLDKELSVYENAKSVHTTLNKETKAVQTEYAKKLKAVDAAAKKVVTKYKTKAKEREASHGLLLEQIASTGEKLVQEHAAKKEDIEAINKQTLATNKKQLAAAKKAITANKKAAEKEQKTGHEKADKTIVQIQEKGQKDQATFDQKLADLKAKYETKITALNEKEEVKKEKLTEAYEKTHETMLQKIQTELDKHNKNLSIVIPTYEEELEEIDEKIELEKVDFDKKYANIKTSADKRIAVREKHMQRAISENDNRSAKQHKKDIAKFQKEADKDLAILEKKYEQQKVVSADYRLNFIKEHFENIASIERAFADTKEELQYQIDKQFAEHNIQLQRTTEEYDQQRADELKLYNETYAATREKQETVKHQELIDVEEQRTNKLNIDLTFAAQIEILEERTKAAQESFEKDERLRQHDFDTQNLLNDNTLALEQDKLAAQVDIAAIELDRDLKVLVHEEQKEHHELQDKRHTAQKEAFNKYQQQFKPALLSRFETVQDFQKEDVQKHVAVQLKVLQAQAKELEKEHQLLLQDVEQRFELERVFFDTQIEAIAGPEQEALDLYVQEQETALETLQNQINQLTERQDRKERKELEHQYDLAESTFKNERASKEQALANVVGVYQDALNQLQERHDIAIKDVNDLYQQNMQLVTQDIERVEQAQEQALQRFEDQKQATEERINTFELQVATRNQQHSEANQTYLDRQLQFEEGHITDIQNEGEAAREARNTVLDQTITEHANQEQTLKSDNATYHQDQNQAFEAYQEASNETIQLRQSKLSQDHQTESANFESKKQQILSDLDQAISTIRENLDEQNQQYEQTIAGIKAAEEEASRHLENEHKRVKQEFEDRLKEEYKKVDQRHKANIQSMN